MANTMGEKELKTKWPHETGLTATSKHEGRKVQLIPTKGSIVPRRRRVFL